MDYFYAIVILVCILSMITLAVDVGRNVVLDVSNIRWFRLTFILVAVGALCEFLGATWSRLQYKGIFIHTLVTLGEFCITPMLAVFLAKSCGVRRKLKLFDIICIAHAVLEIVLIPFGSIFYIDSEGVYQRGTLYWIYLAACAIAFVYILIVFIQLGYSGKGSRLLTISLIAVIFLIGQIATIVDGTLTTGYFSVCVTAILLYVCMQEVIRRQMMDTLSEEKDLAYHDSLTGVASRASYDQKVKEIDELIKKDSTSVHFAVCLCDLNNLKKINDTYGHEQGDAYIKECSNAIGKIFTKSIVYRFGGDEFVIIIQGEDFDRFYELKSRMQDFILREIGKTTDDVLKVKSFASGFAIFDRTTDECVNDVFKHADEEMYVNKKAVKMLYENLQHVK